MKAAQHVFAGMLGLAALCARHLSSRLSSVAVECVVSAVSLMLIVVGSPPGSGLPSFQKR